MASMTKDGISIRRLSESEIPEMIAVWKAARLEHRPKGRDSLRNLKRQRKMHPRYFLGAFSGSRLIGVCLISEDGRRGWINRLAVRPEAQREGVGSLLVTESERILRREGLKLHCTHVARENKVSIALFEKLGYHVEKDILYVTKRDRESY